MALSASPEGNLAFPEIDDHAIKLAKHILTKQIVDLLSEIVRDILQIKNYNALVAEHVRTQA